MEKTFNILELASELAEKDLMKEFKGKIFVDVSEDEVRYTDEAQEYFNELYEEYTDFLIDL